MGACRRFKKKADRRALLLLLKPRFWRFWTWFRRKFVAVKKPRVLTRASKRCFAVAGFPAEQRKPVAALLPCSTRRKQALSTPTGTGSLSSLRQPTPCEEALLASVAKEDNTDIIWQSKHNGEGITGRDLALLLSGKWLNSEIINAYFTLLKVRCDRYLANPESAKFRPRIYCFSSFFYTKYQSSGYAGVQRWTKTIDLFSHDLVLFPINRDNVHWALVAANIRAQRIEYYDSMLCWRDGHHTINSIQDYLRQEAERNQHEFCDFDLQVMNAPQQRDYSSCGTFICAFGDLLARGYSPPFSFSQQDVKQLQLGMASDLLRGLLSDCDT